MRDDRNRRNTRGARILMHGALGINRFKTAAERSSRERTGKEIYRKKHWGCSEKYIENYVDYAVS